MGIRAIHPGGVAALPGVIKGEPVHVGHRRRSLGLAVVEHELERCCLPDGERSA